MSRSDDGTVKPVGGPAPTGAAQGLDSAEGVTGADALAMTDKALAAALRSGELTPAQAQARIIDEMVRAQLGPDASEELVAEIRDEVAALFEDDPAMAALLDPSQGL